MNKEHVLIDEQLLEFANKEEYTDLIEYCIEQIELDNTYFRLFGSRGWAYLMLGQFDNAIADLSQALILESNYIKGLRIRALVYLEMDLSYKASEDFISVLGIESQDNDLCGLLESVNIIPSQTLIYESKNLFDYEFIDYSGDSMCGIYVIEFENGEYYVGQSKHIKRRIKDHFRKYNDIKHIYTKSVDLDRLTEVESETIAMIASWFHRIRNIKQLNFSSIFDASKQQKWISDNSFNSHDGQRFENEEIRLRYRTKFIEFQNTKYYSLFINCMRAYVEMAIPAYVASEYNYWNITCLPNYLKEHGCVSRININAIPVISTFLHGDELNFMIYASKLPFLRLLQNGFSMEELLTQFKSLEISVDDNWGDATQGDEIRFLIDQNEFIEFINHDFVRQSIRLFNLRMMNNIGNETTFRRTPFHCLDLAEVIIDYIKKS